MGLRAAPELTFGDHAERGRQSTCAGLSAMGQGWRGAAVLASAGSHGLRAVVLLASPLSLSFISKV